MKKKSKMTYADKAKAIMSRYKKRLGENFERYDKMASDALNRELSQLMEQQELAKQKQTEQQFQQMAYGGGLPEWPLDPFYRPPGVTDFSDTDIKPFPSRMQQIGFDAPTMPNYIGKITQPQVTQPKASPTPKPNTWWSNLPIESRIGMVSQLAGNLGQGILAATAGKPDK